MKYITFIVAGFLAIVSLHGCKKSSDQQTVYYSDALTLGSGYMKSWIKTGSNGKPVSVGLTISETAIASLPATDTMCMIMLPMNMGSMMNMAMPSPIDHIELDWAPHGDSGSAIFNHPHLDCHFFTISSAAQMGIMMGMDTTMIGASYMPQHCVSDSETETDMGAHVYDTLSSEYHGAPFAHTFMYGFYQGNMTFIEVMCAKSFLDTKTNYSGSIAQPQAFRQAGYYPTQYTVSYNAGTKEYTYSLDNLSYR